MTLWEAISSPANFPNYDSRNDLGLGKTQSQFFSHRNSQDTYPYNKEDDDFESEEDFEDIDPHKFLNKLLPRPRTDSLSYRSVDNQYYTPGASTRFDMGKLGEAIGSRSSRTSMVPMPDLYKNKQAVIGGANSWNANHKDIQHTKGTKNGYAKGHIVYKDEISAWEDEKNDADDPVSKIRRIVNAYHDMNLLLR